MQTCQPAPPYGAGLTAMKEEVDDAAWDVDEDDEDDF